MKNADLFDVACDISIINSCIITNCMVSLVDMIIWPWRREVVVLAGCGRGRSLKVVCSLEICVTVYGAIRFQQVFGEVSQHIVQFIRTYVL